MWSNLFSLAKIGTNYFKNYPAEAYRRSRHVFGEKGTYV